MLANPILRKEVLSSLRTRRAVLMQAMYLLTIAALLWMLWPADGLQDLGGQQARKILGVLAVGQLVLVALFAPAFTAASLTSEKEHRTFESLFTTALRPWEIATGKMAGSLSFLLLMVLSGTPALAVLGLLGGVSGGEILAVVALLLLTAIYLGMIGLWVSAVSHRSARATVWTYAILGILCFLVAVPAWPVSSNLLARSGPVMQAVLHVLASFSPLQAMMSLIWPGGQYTTGAEGMPAFWVLFIPISVVMIGVVATVCLRKLHRPVAPPRPRERMGVVERGQFSARSVMFIVDPRKRKKPISWWQNPVLVKEFRTRPMLQMHWLLRTIVICLIVSILLMFLVAISIQALASESVEMLPNVATAAAALMTVLLLLLGPAMTGGNICSDIETGVWDLLRTTPVPSWRIVSGKFQAAILPLMLIAASMVPAMFVLLYIDTNILPNLLRALQVVGMTVLFVATAGTFFSAMFKRTSMATAWTYALVVSISLLSLLALLGEELFSERLLATVFVANPVAAAMAAAGFGPMQKYSLVGPHLRLMGIVTAAMFVITVVRVFQLRRADLR